MVKCCFMVTRMLFQFLHEGPNSPFPKKWNTGISQVCSQDLPIGIILPTDFYSLCSKWQHLCYGKSTHFGKKGSEGFECRAAKFRNTDRLTKQHYDKVFINFFKISNVFTHNLLINSPPILKKKIKKIITCVLLRAEPHPIDDSPTPLFSRL